MSDAEREPAGEEFEFSIGSGRFDRDVSFPGDQWKRALLGRLAEQAAGLRANAMRLGDHIEELARAVGQRRVG
jgi:hypothetical protein